MDKSKKVRKTKVFRLFVNVNIILIGCENYVYDEQYDSYYCDMNLDEDEMLHFLTGNFGNCPYYRDNDEYRIVRKQN